MKRVSIVLMSDMLNRYSIEKHEKVVAQSVTHMNAAGREYLSRQQLQTHTHAHKHTPSLSGFVLFDFVRSWKIHRKI